MQTEPRVGCGVAIVVDGAILLLRRKTEPEAGCWGLPGGKIDLYETAAQAAEREIAEELGIGVRCTDLLCLVNQIDREKGTHWVAPVYRVERYDGEPRNCEPKKHEGPRWFPLDALPPELTTPTRTAVAALERRAGKTA